MRTYIIGTGGVGGYFGALLARAGTDVTFVARGNHFTAISESGLTLRSARGSFRIERPSVIDSVSKIKSPDLVLVFVKTYSTEAVATELATVVSPQTIVVTFQTGLENDLQLLSQLPTKLVFPGLAYINSRIAAPGVIEQISGICTLLFGARRGQDGAALRPVEQLLHSAEIDAQLVSDIELEMWKKLTWIAAFSGVTVLFRSAIGNILDNPDGERILRQLLDETLRVAKANNIAFTEADLNEIFDKISYYKSDGRNAKTSLLLDVEAGRPTEVETMHGALLRFAQKRKVETPLLETVAATVRIHDSQVKSV